MDVFEAKFRFKARRCVALIGDNPSVVWYTGALNNVLVRMSRYCARSIPALLMSANPRDNSYICFRMTWKRSERAGTLKAPVRPDRLQSINRSLSKKPPGSVQQSICRLWMPHFIFFYTSLAVAKVAYEFVQKFFIIWIPQDINAIKSNRICKRRIAFLQTIHIVS